MTYDATSTSMRANVDVNTTIQNNLDAQGKMSHKFQSSNGITSSFEYMQTAELVFPGLDYLAMATAPKEAGFKNKMKRGKRFVDEYMDRRAQAKFVGENPDSVLAQGGKPQFMSKYADPTHPIHSGGSLFNLLNGGQNNQSSYNSYGGSQVQGRGQGMGMGRYYDNGQSRGLLQQRQQQSGFGSRGGGLGGGLGSGGPVGAIFSLVGSATQAIRDRGQNTNTNLSSQYGRSSSAYEQDHYNESNPHAPYGDSRCQQDRSYDNNQSRYYGDSKYLSQSQYQQDQYYNNNSQSAPYGNSGYYDQRGQYQTQSSQQTQQGGLGGGLGAGGGPLGLGKLLNEVRHIFLRRLCEYSVTA
jgi:hypothetical protein